MRGALTIRSFDPFAGRIIPADAGSTTSGSFSSPASSDHPRGCGEHRTRAPVCSATRGSSPRMRGAPWSSNHVCHRHGIIPADAGSTKTAVKVVNDLQDHPRGCGEHLVIYLELKSMLGSSPRMRGALCRLTLNDCGLGIIPADAGSTCGQVRYAVCG